MSIESCRTVSNESFPPVESTTLIIDKELNILMKSGGKMTKSDALKIITDYIPKALDGECKIILVWEGKWRTDAFELKSEDDFDMYKQKLEYYLT